MLAGIGLKLSQKWSGRLGRACLAAAMACLAGCRAPTPAQTAPATALPTLAAPVSAAAVAVDASGTRLAAVNPDSGSVTLVDLPGLAVRAEVSVGTDPRTLAFTPDGS